MSDFFARFSNLFETVQGAAGQPVYLVGGAVRDAMLARPVKDLDFVVQQNARALGKRVANAVGGGFYMLDETRDTARVIYSQEDGTRLFLDFATYRAESLEGDLRDRDFTINAMAVRLDDPGKLIDPTGGADDLAKKQIRACSPLSIKSDPVRILRAVRLSLSLGLQILPESVEQIRSAANLLPRVSSERLRDELFRMFDGPQVATAVRLLDRFGALKAVLPELESLKGVTQSAPHINDVWEHTLAVVQQLQNLFAVLVDEGDADRAANITLSTAVLFLGRYRPQFRAHFQRLINPSRSLRSLLFMAALYHDISKPGSRSVESGGRIRFFEHDIQGARVVERRGKALSLSSVEVQRLVTIVRHHMRIHHLVDTHEEPSRRAVFRYFRAAGDAGIDIILLSLADVLGTYGVTLTQDRWEEELAVCQRLLESYWDAHEETVQPPRLLTGEDLMRQFQLEPGPIIGNLLESLQEAQASGEITSKDEALQFIENELRQKAQEKKG